MCSSDRTTFVLTSEERFDTDEMAQYEAEETLNSLRVALIANSDKRAFILRIDKYNGNKPASRIFPDSKHDVLLAIDELVSYVLNTEDADKLDVTSLDNAFTHATKVHNHFLKKI